MDNLKVVLIVDDEDARLDLLTDAFRRAFGRIHVVCAKSYDEATHFLGCSHIDFISLDHDLGTPATGYDVLKYIQALVEVGKLSVQKIFIHTANVIAAPRMLALAAEIPGVTVQALKLTYTI